MVAHSSHSPESVSEALHNDMPLADAIMDATKSAHVKLNKLIVSRLHLALPPRAADPAIYVSGLLHIAPIYEAFESLWQAILDSTPLNSSADGPNQSASSWENTEQDDPLLSPPIRPDVTEQTHSILARLHLPELLRTERLKADIGTLTGWPAHVIEEQLSEIAATPPLSDFIRHIKSAVASGPHVLLAYAYILYMALFSGGRFIRASLESAGSAFWEQPLSPVRPTLRDCFDNQTVNNGPASQLDQDVIFEAGERSHAAHTLPLRFFHFPTPLDGEDLKREFKHRLMTTEKYLSGRQVEDIVQEGRFIFENMILLIQQLDLACEDATTPSDAGLSIQGLTQLLKNPLASRFRDSVAVAKERHARNSSKRSSRSTDSDGSVIRRSVGRVSKRSGTSKDGDDSSEHPTVPVVTGIELASGLSSKNVRFQPPSLAESGAIFSAAMPNTGDWALADWHIHRGGPLNRIFVVALSVVFLGLFFHSRRSGVDATV